MHPYHSYFGDLTTQSNSALLDALDVRPGVRFLDVASGPGYLAAAAARRGADVVGVDFAEAMVEQARRVYPALAFRIGSAEDLPFADVSFDAVAISFGILHFAHPENAPLQRQVHTASVTEPPRRFDTRPRLQTPSFESKPEPLATEPAKSRRCGRRRASKP